MKTTFFIAAAITALPYAASALISATDANLGKSCWTDGDGPNYKLIKCTPGNVMTDMWYNGCSDTYDLTGSDEAFFSGNGSYSSQGLHCVLSVKSNAFYLCSMEAGISNSPACEEALKTVWGEYPQVEKDFVAESGGTNRSYFTTYSCTGHSTSGYVVTLTGCSSQKEYGCQPGYYHSGGTGSSYACTKCPSPGTSYGNEETGGITTCYIPAGTAFSDDTGSGTYKYDCYYKL